MKKALEHVQRESKIEATMLKAIQAVLASKGFRSPRLICQGGFGVVFKAQ